MQTGISIYLSRGFEKNLETLDRAARFGMSFAFSSLQIPEEDLSHAKDEVAALVAYARERHIKLICDIGPRTLALLGASDVHALKDIGLDYLRLDDGFSERDAAELSQSFYIVVNASTITRKSYQAWIDAGAKLSHFLACHNFYPKPLCGLSHERVLRINERLHMMGIKTMAFVPGDGELRGPLHLGLPTIEDDRYKEGKDLAAAALDLYHKAACDVVLVGDPNLADATWQAFSELAQGYITLHTELLPDFAFVYGCVHHDRPDSSDYIVRSQESRRYSKEMANIAELLEKAPFASSCSAGTILMSDASYGRYMGELSIAKHNLYGLEHERMVGAVLPCDIELVQHVESGFGWQFVLGTHLQ